MNDAPAFLPPDSDPIILVGGGGHCRSVIDVLESFGCAIAGVVHGSDAKMEPVLGYPALGRDVELDCLATRYGQALVTVGQIKSPLIRVRLYTRLVELGFRLPSVCSGLAHVSRHAAIGTGSIVMHRAIVNAGARVGDNVIVNSCALIEHDSVIGDHCHVAIGAIVAGGTTVGSRTFIGAGAVIRDHVHVGSNCIIGMGAKVIRDVADGASVYG